MNIHNIYRPFLTYFRTRRMRRFWQHFRITPQTRVLDVGGTLFNWSLLPTFPTLTICNISPTKYDRFVSIVADGRYLPFKDGAFNIVYSNSVIEHVGGEHDQRLFAAEFRRVGWSYYVQTPNKKFPIEFHMLTPFVHYLPKIIQKCLLKNFTIWGLLTRPTLDECKKFLKELNLLNEIELQRLFPKAKIWHERFLGLSKSIIAVKISYEE